MFNYKNYLLFTLVVTFSAFSVDVASQDESADIEEVITTGSRIARPEVATSAPVTVVSADDIKTSGLTDLGEILRQISATQGSVATLNTNNGGSGGVRYSLRGIGANRTLLLLNGRRVVPMGNGASASPDLSHIPTAMIERIEILKDGASAIYGSDAMAGVVNIITKKSHDGVTVDLFTSDSQDTNMGTQEFSVVVGTESDKGSTVFGFTSSENFGAFMSEQPWSFYEVWAPAAWADPGDRVEGSNCALACVAGGSSAPPWVRAFGPNGSVTLGPEYGNFRAWAGSDAYNYNPVNYLRTPQEKYSFSMNSNYQISDDLSFFAEVLFSNVESKRALAFEPLAPLAFFGVEAPYTADNYYNMTFGPKFDAAGDLDMANGSPVQIDDWRRRMVENAQRLDDRDTNVFRLVMGLEGTLDNGMNWSAFFNFGRNDADITSRGYFNLEKVRDAAGPTYFDASGDLKCGVDANTTISDACVPLNIFGEGAVTAEMLQYISGDWDSYGMGENEQKNYGASISGAVPGMEKLSFAAGYEYREDSGSTTNDALILQGITTAGSSLNTIGSYEVDDLFVELLYVTGDLELSVASRYSDYSTFGNTTNSEVGFQYQVNDMVGLRGTFSEAFRAPSVPDLYGGTSLGYPTADDACDNNTESGGQATAFCQANGVPATGFVSSIVQIPTLTGGNPNLEPETSESYTLGAVIDPIDGLTMTVDYWSIEIDNAVGTVGTTDLIRLCATQGLYCDRTVRFSAPVSVIGQIIRVEDTNNNVGTETYTGVDLGIVADLPSIAGGDLTFDMQATYNEETQVVTAGGLVVENLAGTVTQTYGMYARWRALTKLNWNKGAINVSYTNRYIHGTTDEVDDFWTDKPEYTEVPEVMFQDIRVSYATDSMGTIALGITNFTDEEVPFVPSAFNANTDQENYDLFGPVISLRYNYTF